MSEQSEPNPAEPIFNIPAAVVATVGVLVLVHAVRVFLLSDQQDFEFVLTFGFIPARYGGDAVLGGALPGGFAADLWTFFTYAFIHAEWTHLGLNLAWLIPFGSVLARRFGVWRYVLFMLTTAAIGAMAHLVSHLGAVEPMIGASAAISGAMAGSMRFIFPREGRVGFFRDPGSLRHLPAQPLGATLRDRRFLLFLATWIGLNALVGFGTISFGAEAGRPDSPGKPMSGGSSPAWFYSPLSIQCGGQFGNLPLSQAFNSDLESILASHSVRRTAHPAGNLWNRTQPGTLALLVSRSLVAANSPGKARPREGPRISRTVFVSRPRAVRLPPRNLA